MIEKLEECISLSKQQDEYIKVIKKGVESLKEHYRTACEYNEKADKEIERLNNIINELEEFKEEHKIMKQILIENNLWETLLNDDRFLEHLRK